MCLQLFSNSLGNQLRVKVKDIKEGMKEVWVEMVPFMEWVEDKVAEETVGEEVNIEAVLRM